MAGHKRKLIAFNDPSSDADLPALAPAITKKSKTGSTRPLNLSGSELAALPSEELVGRVLELQETIKEIQAQLDNEKTKFKELQKTRTQTTLTPIAGNGAAQEWSAEKVAGLANKLADQAAKAIKKQMKWQVRGLLQMTYQYELLIKSSTKPSCKRGTTKWSHTGVAPNTQVFFAMMNLPQDGKAWKQKKISLREFKNAIGDIEASIRYGSLRITGEHVNVKWTAGENSFTLSGTYGL